MITGRRPHIRMKKEQTLKRSHPEDGALEKDPALGPSQITASWQLGVSQYQKIPLLWSLRKWIVWMLTLSPDRLLLCREPVW